MNNIENVLFNYFDLETVSDDEKNEFIQNIGELIMQTILRKAWSELDSVKRSILTELLEKVDTNPKDVKKQKQLFSFLDENLPNINKYISMEIENMRTSYLEVRDEIRDSLS